MKKVGIIGCGKIVRLNHIKGYIATDYGYITGFFDISSELAEKVQQIYIKNMKKRLHKAETKEEIQLCNEALKCKVCKTIEELLDAVDSVDICTPPQFHMHYAKMAADLGKSIMCEKPSSRIYPEVENAFDSIKKVPFYMMTQTIYSPMYQLGKEIIDSNKLGEIQQIQCGRAHGKVGLGGYTALNKNFWDPYVSGGGALIDLGPHAYSVMRYWLGPDYKLKTVSDAGIDTLVKTRKIAGEKNFQVKVDDVGKIDGIYIRDDGHTVKTRVEAYWGKGKHLPKGFVIGYYNEVKGSKGTMTFPHYSLGLLLGKTPYFRIHAYYKISYTDGTREKITIPLPNMNIKTNTAINEFLSEVKSRNPAWFAEDMMLLFDGAFLSKKRNGKDVTPDELRKYCSKFVDDTNIEKGNEALIRDLFNLS
ncbi:MAG: Gfo/Idh/MocA family oxidoreductase [archaeon]|nr:Gfo/Idh/MocA family oxidoreductase [archaeon]